MLNLNESKLKKLEDMLLLPEHYYDYLAALFSQNPNILQQFDKKKQEEYADILLHSVFNKAIEKEEEKLSHYLRQLEVKTGTKDETYTIGLIFKKLIEKEIDEETKQLIEKIEKVSICLNKLTKAQEKILKEFM